MQTQHTEGNVVKKKFGNIFASQYETKKRLNSIFGGLRGPWKALQPSMMA